MYIKKLKQQMDRSGVELFLFKHKKFRLLSEDEVVENGIKNRTHLSDNKTHGEVLPVYLAYSNEYLDDLNNCKITIDKLGSGEQVDGTDYLNLKKFFNRYIYR